MYYVLHNKKIIAFSIFYPFGNMALKVLVTPNGNDKSWRMNSANTIIKIDKTLRERE